MSAAGGPQRTITLYTRDGCHLCAEAAALLRKLQPEFGYQVREVDVDSDPALTSRYGERVPVIAYGYREVVAALITERRLRDALRRAMGRG